MTTRPARAGRVPAAVALPLSPEEESPFLRPRTRTRVRRVRRGWTAHVALVLQLGAAVVFGAALLWMGVTKTLSSPHLRVDHILVRGNHFLSEGEIRELLGPANGTNILTLDIIALTQRLRESPWLEGATVRRTLPDLLQVDVHERRPMALVEIGRLYLMDAEGDVIDTFGAAHTTDYDLPILRGLEDLEEEARRERARRAAGLLDDLGDLQVEISEIFVTPGGDLRIVLRGAGEVLKMGAPPYRERFLAFLSLRSELGEHSPGAEYFDLRFRNRIYAKRPALPGEHGVRGPATGRAGGAAAARRIREADGDPREG